MCVDKHHYKCCRCLTLTQATLILGLIYIIGAIYYVTIGSWINFAIWIVASVLFIMVLFKPHDAMIRKLLFYIGSILSIIGLVAIIIAFLIFLVNGDWYNACAEYSWGDHENCVENAKLYMIISFTITLLLDLALVYCTLQILYFGWKE